MSLSLEKHVPFNLLSPEEWAITGEWKVKEVKANKLLYRQGSSSLRELSFILEGEVEKFFQQADGQRVYTERLQAGDTFGEISILLNNKVAIRSVRSLKPCKLYQLPDTIFLELCQKNQNFADYFLEKFGKKMLSQGYARFLLQHTQEAGGLDFSDQSFQQPVQELVSGFLNTCPPEASIRDAAQLMTQNRRAYVLVMATDGVPMGMITDLDLRQKVIIEGKSSDAPVHEIMNSPVLEISGSAYAYEAILKMFRYAVNHLIVTEGKELRGVVTMNKLLGAREKAPFLFFQQINRSVNTEDLLLRWAQTPGMVQGFLKRGIRPEIVNQIVTTISDAITQKLLARGMAQLGPPPARFVFMALGSEGRQEQSLATDQDNAIIYEDVGKDRRAEVREYFLALGTWVNDQLNEVGFAYCDGGLMAKNPKWTHSLSHWKANYSQWLNDPFRDSVLKVSTFFDARAVYGEASFVEALKSHIFQSLAQSGKLIFAQLSRISLGLKPPLSFLGNFILTENPSQEKRLDIKKAMMSLADYARIYALHEQIHATNTGERLQLLKEKGVLSAKEYQELHQAYYFMMRLRLSHQANMLMQSRTHADNLLDINELSKLERATLKEIFKLVQQYQQRLSMVFTGSLL